MARVIYGGVGLQGLSGSINKQAGGHTFTKDNRVRRRVVPTNPQTASQGNARALFSFLTTAWASLSEIQKEAWETAKNTNSYYLKQDTLTGVSRKYGSAKDLFIAMNTNLVITDPGASPYVALSSPATPAGQDDTGGFVVTMDASSGTVSLAYTGTQATERTILRMTPPVSAGNLRATSVKSKFRKVFGDTLSASPVAAASAYTALFGAITGQTGQKVFWEVYNVDEDSGKARFVAGGSTIIVA